MNPSTQPHMQNPLIRFYLGEGPDAAGRYLRDIRGWDFARLERVHDFIQWLFPTRQRSQFNANAPELGEAEIDAFRENEQLRTELAASLRQMLAFYGFDYQETADGSPVIGPGPGWEARSAEWFGPGDHNLLRITRILDCLSTLGLATHARAFLSALEAVCQAAPGTIPDNTQDFWRRAARG